MPVLITQQPDRACYGYHVYVRRSGLEMLWEVERELRQPFPQ
jgi:hypothetical protein